MNPKAKYWVLVANSGQARILEMQRKPYAFHQVTELVSEAQHLTNKEIVSDASGRVYHTQGPGTHSMKPRSDPHENAEEQFSRGLAQKLEKAASLGRFVDQGDEHPGQQVRFTRAGGAFDQGQAAAERQA